MKQLSLDQRINIRAAISRAIGGNIISEHFVNIAVCSDPELVRVSGICLGYRNTVKMYS